MLYRNLYYWVLHFCFRVQSADNLPEWTAAATIASLHMLNFVTIVMVVRSNGAFASVNVEFVATAAIGATSLLTTYLLFIRGGRWRQLDFDIPGEARANGRRGAACVCAYVVLSIGVFVAAAAARWGSG